MTLMRLRVELNSSTLSSSYCTVLISPPPGNEGSSSSMPLVVRPLKKNPNRFAATTNALSSGDSAW